MYFPPPPPSSPINRDNILFENPPYFPTFYLEQPNNLRRANKALSTPDPKHNAPHSE